jgi:ABC-type Mn2+/Zn2+ transport system ATPase subunit
MEQAHLALQHVSAGYPGLPHALQDLTFEVPPGMRLAVVGPNGAGKSTLFKTLVGLLPVLEGQITVHGQPLGAHKDCVAYIPQREAVDWRFPVTVADVVLMGRYGHAGWFGRFTNQDRQAAKRAMQALGVAEFAKRSIRQLSGGQQQRVFLARALAQEPHILLMDEPFTGIDAPTQDATLALLDDLKAQGVTVIVSTHDLAMAAERFEQVLLLNHRLVAYGPPGQVFHPENVRQAFGGHAMLVEGVMVVDECCSHEEKVAPVQKGDGR